MMSNKNKKITIFILLFAIIGATLLIITKAVSPTASLEAENGQLNTQASIVTDSTASNGKAVLFNKANSTSGVSSATPCVGSAAPSQWKHVIVLMFENHTYSQVIGNTAFAPYTTGLVAKCATVYSGTTGTSPKNNWHDSNFKVDGSTDGSHNSAPSYAVLTSGIPASVSGYTSDSIYPNKINVDNIYNQLRLAGKSGKNYFGHSGTGCSSSGSGDYHDAIRYYSNIDSAYCDAHDVNISTFMNDLNNKQLADFSMILPTNDQNTHNNSGATDTSGDTWAMNFLVPIMDSAQYKSGDTAIFFLWDEDTPIPNVLIAPSIKPGSQVPAPSGNPISHYSALRTWEEMLGIPFIGDSGQAPSLLSFFNGQ